MNLFLTRLSTLKNIIFFLSTPKVKSLLIGPLFIFSLGTVVDTLPKVVAGKNIFCFKNLLKVLGGSYPYEFLRLLNVRDLFEG